MEPLLALALLAAIGKRSSPSSSATSSAPCSSPPSPANELPSSWTFPYPVLTPELAERFNVRPEPLITDGPGAGKRRSRDGSPRWHEGVDLFYQRRSPVERPDDGGSRRFVTPPGTPVLAPAAGRVWSARRTARGWRVVLDHGRPWASVLTHLDELVGIPVVDAANRNTISVEAGQVLGTAGADPLDPQGLVHLHYELHREGRWVDPTAAMRRWRRVPYPA